MNQEQYIFFIASVFSLIGLYFGILIDEIEVFIKNRFMRGNEK